MMTRRKGKLKIWLFDECVVDAIRGSKPPTSKTVHLHFRCLHFELKEKELGETAQVAVENIKQWWLHQAGIPTKADNTLINMF